MLIKLRNDLLQTAYAISNFFICYRMLPIKDKQVNVKSVEKFLI